jgi:WD40 repeat protein
MVISAWSPDGTRILTMNHDEKTARVWDAATGGELARLEVHCPNGRNDGRYDCSVLSAAWAPNGTRIITVSSDTARVWDAATGRETRTPRRP